MAAQTQVDEGARKAWVQQVLASPTPPETLLALLAELDARQDIAMQAALFESVLWRVEVAHYWVFFRMARVYAELGRAESSFLMAAHAVRLQPGWESSHAVFQMLFRGFAARGDAYAAMEVFLRQVALYPERPIADRHEIEPLARALGVRTLAADAGDGTAAAAAAGNSMPSVSHRVVDGEARPATPVHAVAGMLPHGLARLSDVLARAPIDVVELADGELLVCKDSAVVRDAAGVVREDLSLGTYPELIARRLLQPSDDEPVEQHEVAEAVLILDAFPPPNLCHFLFDQLSRLELYRRAGADLAEALVVGPELRTRFQRAIARRAGMHRVLGSGRLARVRARRLWVSTECRALQHPAHLGAGWAIEHARAVLGGRGGGGAGGRRLYLSRADSPARQVQNEAELVAVLAQFGFESIVPGAMTYEDQLAAFRAASHVVGAHGAALSHIVLCPPGARVLELFHPLYGTWAYAMIAAGCGLDYAALCGRDGLSDAPGLNDPGLVDLAAGRFGERHLRVDPEAVRQWLQRVG